MKVLAVFICALTVVACNPVSNADWEDFKNNFGKSYDTTNEEQYRRAIFEGNTKIVNEHNERFNNGIETYNLKINEYADMTNIEFVAQMNGLKTSTIQSRNVFVYDPEDHAAATVDWRNKGAVTSVKNQEQCGSCWAFSTTGSLEGQHFLKTGQLVSLSEQNLVDCSKEYGNNGCGGGLMDNAFKYIKANKGIDTEESYPYTAKDGKCNFDASNVGATLTGYVDVHHGNETALMHAVHKIGPISIGIDATGSQFQLYHSGVYYNKECSSKMLDHGVLAVGYGEDNGKAYWLVKNSWGQSWGQEGYIMMSRNKDNNCGVATQASYPLV